jgi:4-hydroxythreonine-4-phosphate dehydrogenase
LTNKKLHLVITSGEPAGIGPEVSFLGAMAFLKQVPDVNITILGDRSLFEDYLTELNIDPATASRLHLEHIPLFDKNTFGQLNLNNSPYVLSLLDRAIDSCLAGTFDAMITAPLQKSVMNECGIRFTGHTEYLAEKMHVQRVVMMLSGKDCTATKLQEDFRVALVTTHLPLREVPDTITFEAVLETIQIVHQALKDQFGISKPRLKVTGLNPHAGEGGHLGLEEIEIIQPAIKCAKDLDIDVTGPYPADTLFDLSRLSEVDAFIAMYHDQGLAPFKLACFGQGVNVTLGLPIIRTSVDHGTALMLAGKRKAEISSMVSAIELAFELAQHGTSNS